MAGSSSSQRGRITLLGSGFVIIAVLCVLFLHSNNTSSHIGTNENNALFSKQDHRNLQTLQDTLSQVLDYNKETHKTIDDIATDVNNIKSNQNNNVNDIFISKSDAILEALSNHDKSVRQVLETSGNDHKVKSVSPEEWQDMLSFLHMDSHALCEDIFNAAPGKGYPEEIKEYYEIDGEHDKYLSSLNLTRLFEDFDGHSSRYREETYVMWKIAKLPFVKTVCETGFNAGHSVHLWLSAKPDIKVYSFDIGGFKAAKPMSEYLHNKFPGRLTVTWGDSTQTLPQFIQEHPEVKCDLLVVDGGHDYNIASSDIRNFQKMVRGEKNILFMDNYPDRRFGNMHARAWEQFKRRGEVLEIFQCHYQNLLQGFTFGRYLV